MPVLYFYLARTHKAFLWDTETNDFPVGVTNGAGEDNSFLAGQCGGSGSLDDRQPGTEIKGEYHPVGLSTGGVLRGRRNVYR